MTQLAIIRIRGQVRNNPKRHIALALFRLTKKFSVILHEDTPVLRGKLKLVSPDVTWGDVSQDIVTTLVKKYPNQTVYHLNPPRGGLGRKGLKMAYTKKGAFGNRGAAINKLLQSMI